MIAVCCCVGSNKYNIRIISVCRVWAPAQKIVLRRMRRGAVFWWNWQDRCDRHGTLLHAEKWL